MDDIYLDVGTNWLKSKVSDDFTTDTHLYIENIISSMSFGGGLRILDMCCGYGRVSIPLSKRGHFVVGFDVSETLLKSAESAKRKELLNNVMFVRADMLKLPFREKTFDIVLCMWASFNFVAHIEDQLNVINELAAILLPGGVAIIDLPNEHSSSEKLLTLDVSGSVYHYFQHTKRHLEHVLSSSLADSYKIEECMFGAKDRIIVVISKNV